MSNFQYLQEGKGLRFLSPLNVWALSFGCIIGWGAFIMPGTMFLPNAGPLGTIIAMGLGALIMLVIGANFCRLGERYRDNGGIFTYTRMLLGHDHAFLAAWSLGLAYLSLLWANATAFVLLSRYFLGDFLEWGLHYQVLGFDIYFGEILATWGILIFFGLFACYGGRLRRNVHSALALLLIAIVVGLCIGVDVKTIHTGFSPAFQPDISPGMQVFSMLMLAPWMFIGFEAVTHAQANFSFKPKRLYIIATLAILCGALTYVLLTTLAVLSIPEEFDSWTTYIESLHELSGIYALPVFHSVMDIFGMEGAYLLGIAMFAALSTSLLGFYRATAFLFQSMARAGLLPEKIGLEDKDSLPHHAILLIIALSLPVPLLGRNAIAWLTDVTTISGSIAYGYASFCALIMSRAEGSRLGKALGITGLLFSFCFFFFPILPNLLAGSALDSESYLLLAAWSIVGFVYYWYVFKHDKNNHFGRSTVMCIILLFLTFFSTSMWIRQVTIDRLQAAVHEGVAISHNALSMTSILQMIFIMIILGLMFNIFTTIRNREEKLDQKILASHTLSQVKNTYLANVSHDIQLLTNSFIGYVQMSLETCAICTVCQEEKAHPEVPQAMGEALGHIEPLNHYLLSLIQSMLRVNSMDEGTVTLKETHTDLNHTMKQIRNVFSALMEEKGITFRVDNQIEDALVKCDNERLLRLLMNLISNAYNASGEGNEVTVTLRQLGPGYHPEGGGRWHRRQTCVDYELTVKDTGQGMPPTLAGRLQELLDMDSAPTFSSLLDMGRGMYVVKTIVNRMNGTISFATGHGTGTEFKIRLTFAISRQEDNEA